MLRDYFIENNVSVYAVSEKTGIPYSTLNDLVIEKTDIKKTSSDTLYRLSKFFKVSMECLYNGTTNEKMNIYLYNTGRNITLSIKGTNYTYLGPKNILSFHRINKIEEHVIYVDTYFTEEDGTIYNEEDYVDMKDVLSDYNAENLLSDPYQVILRSPNSKSKTVIIDEALMVSDNFAFTYISNSADKTWIKATNLSRPSLSMTFQVEDKLIISTNLSAALQKRVLSAIERNQSLLMEEIAERSGVYA